MRDLMGIRPPRVDAPSAANVHSLCLTDRAELVRVRDDFRPEVVVHAGGVCDLDVCEERPEWAHELNVTSARNIAEVFAGIRVVYLSTDLVFSGERPPAGGYREDCPTDPVSVVGQTFVLAEREIERIEDYAILRLGLPLGDSIQGTKGAVDWISHRLRRQLPVTLFHDELRTCIDCAELARVVDEFLCTQARGCFHLGGPEPISLFELGERVVQAGRYDRRLLKQAWRKDEIDGPPRIGNVALDSAKIESLLDRPIRACCWDRTDG